MITLRMVQAVKDQLTETRLLDETKEADCWIWEVDYEKHEFMEELDSDAIFIMFMPDNYDEQDMNDPDLEATIENGNCQCCGGPKQIAEERPRFAEALRELEAAIEEGNLKETERLLVKVNQTLAQEDREKNYDFRRNQ